MDLPDALDPIFETLKKEEIFLRELHAQVLKRGSLHNFRKFLREDAPSWWKSFETQGLQQGLGPFYGEQMLLWQWPQVCEPRPCQALLCGSIYPWWGDMDLQGQAQLKHRWKSGHWALMESPAPLVWGQCHPAAQTWEQSFRNRETRKRSACFSCQRSTCLC